jgi:hypothetical protein
MSNKSLFMVMSCDQSQNFIYIYNIIVETIKLL